MTTSTTKSKCLAITGNIGCGKSMFAHYLVEMDKNAILYSFDSLWKNYLNNSDSDGLKSKIRYLFGSSVVSSENLIDFNNLRNFVYSSNHLYNQYNDLIKPYVEDLFLIELSQARKYVADGHYVFFELPLLFEYGYQDKFDFIICVGCSRDTQMQRVFERNPNIKYTTEQFNLIVENQWNISKKMLYSDAVIWNDENLDNGDLDLYSYGTEIWRRIKKI